MKVNAGVTGANDAEGERRAFTYDRGVTRSIEGCVGEVDRTRSFEKGSATMSETSRTAENFRFVPWYID